MGVSIKTGQPLLFPLTSPSSKPSPAPDKTLVAKSIEYGDREIVVTVPFPDTVELVGNITNDVLDVPDFSKKSEKLKYQELDQDIQNSLSETAFNLPPSITASVHPNKTSAIYFAEYDPAQPLNRARVSLSRSKGPDFGSWMCRLEFNAFKAGPAGLDKIHAALMQVLPFVNSEEMLRAFRVSRVDAAIDCIGANPLDLIAHVPKPGKRMVFVGEHGRPESVYYFASKKPFKKPPESLGVRTFGPQRLTLYERRDYHLQLSLQPPYGDCPFTRAEVVRTWKKDRPYLSELLEIPNLFASRRVAYAAAVQHGGNGRSWRQYCLAAFGGGVAKSLSSWLPGSGPKFAAAYQNCAGDLIDETCWLRWCDGVKYTGLDKWIAIASAQ